MDSGKYVRCRNCEAIHHVTPFDRSPIFQYSSGEIRQIPADDWRDFTAQHAGHKLEPLTVTGNQYVPAGSAADPMSAVYLEVTNGVETFLLHKTRRSIEEPVGYTVVQGRLIESGPNLEVQEHAIRKEIKRHFSRRPGEPLEDAKVDLFIALFRDVVRGLDPQTVTTSEDCCEDNDLVYCQLEAAACKALLAKCSQHFSPSELAVLERFVETHRDGCDVMALIKQRAVRVERRADS